VSSQPHRRLRLAHACSLGDHVAKPPSEHGRECRDASSSSSTDAAARRGASWCRPVAEPCGHEPPRLHRIAVAARCKPAARRPDFSRAQALSHDELLPAGRDGRGVAGAGGSRSVTRSPPAREDDRRSISPPLCRRSLAARQELISSSGEIDTLLACKSARAGRRPWPMRS